jgi:acyl transferase domain-containing protein
MAKVASRYLKLMANKISAQDPEVPFYSSVNSHVLSKAQNFGPQYWVDNLVSPVCFSGAVSDILESMKSPKTFVEVGPHAALAGPIRQILQSHMSTDEYINVLSRNKDSYAEVLRAVGELWLSNYVPNMEAVVGHGEFLTNLPRYPWHYEEPLLWYESRLAREYRLREFSHHELLGSRILETTAQSPAWRNMLRLESVPWIKEHEVGGDIVLPGVGYLCMAGEAIRQLTGSVEFTAQHVHVSVYFLDMTELS